MTGDQETRNWLDDLLRAAQTDVTDYGLAKDFRRRRQQQDHHQRGWLFWFVVTLMAAEVLAMFWIITCQGLGRVPWTKAQFNLDKWVIGAFEAGILLQTFGLAKIITAHLFPLRTEQVVTEPAD